MNPTETKKLIVSVCVFGGIALLLGGLLVYWHFVVCSNIQEENRVLKRRYNELLRKAQAVASLEKEAKRLKAAMEERQLILPLEETADIAQFFRSGIFEYANETGIRLDDVKKVEEKKKKRMKAPIVPMAVIGSEKALPKGKLVMRPTQVLVRVGEPIYYFREYSPDTVTYNDIRKLTDQLREIITQLKLSLIHI